MKLPYIEYSLYMKVLEETKQDSIIRTTSRSSTIISKFVGKTLSIHNGKTTNNISIVPAMCGQKIGSFVLTKKLGNSIHNSDHNRKAREKARRKITQKKVRKTTSAPKATKKTTTKKK